jgi:hypothetical protein
MMRKRNAILISAIIMIGFFAFAAFSEESEEAAVFNTRSTESMLKNFTLAAADTSSSTNSNISGYLAIWQRFLLTKEGDLPQNVSGLVGGRAAEFSTVGSSPGVGFGFQGFGEKASFNLTGKFFDKNEQSYFAALDLGRIIRSETSITRFFHRLDHDPLTNVDPDPHAQEEFVFTDSNPDDIYTSTRTQIINKTDIVIPSIPFLKFKSQVRYVHENGLQQAKTFEMCTTCHIEGKTQGLDQRTRDFIIGAEVKVKGFVASYAHMGRDFSNKASPVLHKYTNPYGSFLYSGEQEFALIPDAEKNADTFKAKVDALKNASLFGSYTLATVKNLNNKGEADIKNFVARARALLGKGFNLSVRYLNNSYENTMDPNAYYDDEPVSANHLSRDGFTIGADASYRIPKQKINLRAGFDYKSLKRTFSWADDFDEEKEDIIEKYLEETKTTTFRAGVTFAPTYKFKGFVRFKMKNIDNPFGVPRLQEENPVDPTTERFMSNLYTNVNLLTAGVSFIPTNRVALSANYFFNSSKNDSLMNNDNLNSSLKRNNLVLSIWYGASNKASLTAAYTYLDEKVVNTLVYGTQYEWAGVRIAREDPDIPFNKKAHVFLLALDLRPSEEFSLFGDVSYTTGDSHWVCTAIVKGVSTEDLCDYSDQDITHIKISLGASYMFLKNMSIFGKWKFEDFKDKAFIIHGEGGYEDSGNYHILYCGFSYKF